MAAEHREPQLPADRADALRRFTHIDTACVLIEFHGRRLLTDPAFDPPGGWYWFGWGTGARKRSTPAIRPAALPRVDAVLLSHDQHADNLDRAGRRWLAGAPLVLTTRAAAGRLAGLGPELVGLAPGERTRLESPGRPDLLVEAVAAQHRPRWLPEAFSGPVVGFLLWPEGDPADLLYVTGDTVPTPAVRAVVEARRPRALVCHVGAVAFPWLLGPARFTMTAEQAAELAELAGARSVLAVHSEGWSHFRQDGERVRAAFAARGIGERLLSAAPGVGIPF